MAATGTWNAAFVVPAPFQALKTAVSVDTTDEPAPSKGNCDSE